MAETKSKSKSRSLAIAELETQRLPLSEVTPHPDNPRIHSPEQIKAIEQSLIMDGYIAGSMAIQRSTRILYKGNGVYQALLNLRCYEADFVVKDLTDAETLALLARDNSLSDMSTNDPIKLKAISVNLQAMNVPIQRMGYTLKEITAMQPMKEVTEDDPPEVEEGKPVTQTGDLWLLGKHRVLAGDSTKAEDVERVMGGEKADCVVSSPPYPGLSFWAEGESVEEQASDLIDLNRQCLQVVHDVMQKDSVLCWQVANVPLPGKKDLYPFTIEIHNILAALGMAYYGEAIWAKPFSHLSPPSFMRRPCILNQSHEYILLYFNGEWQPRETETGLGDELKQDRAKSIWSMATDSAKRIGHVTPYPVQLPAKCIGLFSLEAEAILDPFLGSGTTLIAADQLDRVCYGIEISPAYCDVIVKRYMNAHPEAGAGVIGVERNGKTLTWEQAERKFPKVV